MTILNMVTKGSWWWGNVWEPSSITATASWTTATIKWTDGDDLNTIPPTTFAKSVLVRKVGSAPTSPSDWTTVVTETVKNTYSSTGYDDAGLTGWTTYYYQVFSYSDTGGITYWTPVSVTPQSWWQPDPTRTLFYFEFEDNLNDSSDNHNDATWSNLSYIDVWWQKVVQAGTDCNISVPQLWASIGSWDFALSFWLNPVAPSSWRYPMLFWMWTDTSYYAYIFYDPLNVTGWWDTILRMVGWSNYYWTASDLYNWWHHLVMTRISWTVYCYIDKVEVGHFSGNTAFTSGGTSYILSRANAWNTQTWDTPAKADKYILEKVWWSVDDVKDYYDQTKSTYGL